MASRVTLYKLSTLARNCTPDTQLHVGTLEVTVDERGSPPPVVDGDVLAGEGVPGRGDLGLVVSLEDSLCQARLGHLHHGLRREEG